MWFYIPAGLIQSLAQESPNKSLMNVKGCVFYLHDDMQVPKSQQPLLIPNSMAVQRKGAL